jgi:hypothetical protein
VFVVKVPYRVKGPGHKVTLFVLGVRAANAPTVCIRGEAGQRPRTVCIRGQAM